jgi:Cu2+-containing amine oxidase
VGPNGIDEDFPSPIDSSVAVEVRDRGLAHLCTRPMGDVVRRGSEVAVWAVFDPGNYDNIMEYTFRDDGSIGFRAGVTGFNHPDHQDTGHMHNTLWRVDLDLNGHAQDTAHLWQHVESGPMATDDELPFNNGYEGFAWWNPLRFTALSIEDAATNANGHHLGYVLQPWRTGNARHFGPEGEAWTHWDLGVTRFHGGEPDMTGNAYTRPGEYLMSGGKGASNKEPITSQDLVLWHVTSAHHDPHDEDRAVQDVGTANYQGITAVHWSGFDLLPHNLFDHNPLGGPQCAQ